MDHGTAKVMLLQDLEDLVEKARARGLDDDTIETVLRDEVYKLEGLE